MQAPVNEIFESVQGEGILTGYKQIFVRFAGCNLNCSYCDTDYTFKQDNVELNEEELFDKIKKYDAETISLTGGEPLLYSDFIKSFLNKYKKFLKKEIYLETNGILYSNLNEIINFIDIVAMDIKLESATGQTNNFEDNEKFLDIASKTACFIKIVFDSNIKKEEIETSANLALKYNIPIVLQPKMPLDNTDYLNIYNKFYYIHKDIRLIPQMHKFLNIR